MNFFCEDCQEDLKELRFYFKLPKGEFLCQHCMSARMRDSMLIKDIEYLLESEVYEREEE